MDYIQKDLDLIRMASGENVKDEKEKKVPKKEKTTGKSSQARSKPETTVKVKMKPGRKTLSPKGTVAGKPAQKEKRGRRSLVGRPPGKKSNPTLGKIKLPSMKKSNPSSDKIQSNITPPKRTLQAAKPSPIAKESPVVKPAPKPTPPATAPPSRGAPSRKRRVLDPDAVPIDGICFEEGARIEAVDHGHWYRARIVKVDQEKMDILVHFDGWGPRFDTWFPMTSSLIRGRTEVDAKPDFTKYESGEDVLAKWSDGNFYPATILSVKETGSCQVMYFDGMKKLLRPNLIKKMSEQEKEAAMQAAQKLLLATPIDISSPVSSDSTSALTADSEFRKYKTSANDRERRIAARSGGGTPSTTPKAAPRRRGRKRKAPPPAESELPIPEAQIVTPEEPLAGNTDAFYSKRLSSDDDAFIAKKARLDKITSNLVNKVSPVSDKSKEEISTPSEKKAADTESDMPVQPVKFHLESYSPVISPTGFPSEDEAGVPAETGRKSPVLISNRSMQRENSNKRKPATPTHVQPAKTPDSSPKMKSPKNEEIKTRSNETSSKSDSPSTSNTQSEASVNTAATNFKVGDIVLAKWADCRSYLAYILEKESHDQYKVRYYDGMVKVVKASFIHPWVGPLPDSLKSFKPKEPPTRKQRSRSIDLKSRSKISASSTMSLKASTQRRRTISVAKRTEVSPPPIRRRRQSESKETTADVNKFAVGEKVIAKWTDLRWYPATIVSKKDNEHYEVRYHDKMTKIVRDTWLNQWAPNFPTNSTDASPKDASSEVKEESLKAVEKRTSETEMSPLVAQSRDKGRKRFNFIAGSSVLAKYTDGKHYPATVKDCLEDDMYLVEFDNGIRTNVKYSRLKPWNPLALPPIYKHSSKSLVIPEAAADVPSMSKANLSVKLNIPKPVGSKEKPAMLWSSQSAKMPRQVVRGYDAYYSGLPKQNVDVERQLFACRVPGCTKRFRKEDMLRQHHKVYHQKRYKLRDQKSHPGPVRRRGSKDDRIRRRVSADYNALSQSQNLGPTVVNGSNKLIPLAKRGEEKAITSGTEKIRVRGETENTPQSVSSADAILISKAQAAEQVPRRKRGRPARKRPVVEEPDKAEEPPKVEKVTTPVKVPSPPEPEEEEETSATVIEEVIRCSCGSEEEEGVMIQCEGCFTWQHIACIGLNQKQRRKSENGDHRKNRTLNANEKEENVKAAVDGDGYICWVCKNPQNVRKSCKYSYNNDFLTKGKLPSLMNFMNPPEKVKSSKDAADPAMLSSLLDEVTKMEEVLYGIKQKINLANTEDENILLKTWEDLNGAVNIRQPSISADGEKSDVSSGAASQDADDKTDIASQKLKLNPKDEKATPPQKLSGESHESYILRCRENLLDHIAQLEAELMERVDILRDYVATLQSSSDEEEQNVDDLQKTLSVAQALLARC